MLVQVGVVVEPAVVARGLAEVLRDGGLEPVPVAGDALEWVSGDDRRVLLLGEEHPAWQRGVPQRVVAVVGELTPGSAARLLEVGASVVVTAAVDGGVLSGAIRLAAEGWTAMPRSWLDDAVVWRAEVDPSVDASDVELLQALADGATVVQLARDLHYSERTVHSRLSGIYRRLGVTGRAQAIAEAARRGWLR